METYPNPVDEICPTCGSSNPVELVYAPHSAEMLYAAEAGRIALSLTPPSYDSAAYLCRNSQCTTKWGLLGEL
ncbi:MAG: hypothetical protein JWP30_1042 [Homoserinimonas sp.]|jgi:hypothetical protein|nr:hypothetical protein [Homoserinimonas sp.]